jgi:hypothetical protein
LRTELENIKERYVADSLAASEREKQSNETQRWLFGLIAALFTTIVGAWLKNHFDKKATAESMKA